MGILSNSSVVGVLIQSSAIGVELGVANNWGRILEESRALESPRLNEGALIGRVVTRGTAVKATCGKTAAAILDYKDIHWERTCISKWKKVSVH